MREGLSRGLTLVLFYVILMMSVAAMAATVQDIQGNVWVSRGDGFAQVKDPITVEDSDTVMAGPNGGATIVYSNGCRFVVEPDTVVPVGQNEQCTLAATDLDTAGAAELDTTLFAVGAAIVGVTIGGVILATQGGDDKPASP